MRKTREVFGRPTGESRRKARMKKLIVNADDFGFSDHMVEWTIKGFE